MTLNMLHAMLERNLSSQCSVIVSQHKSKTSVVVMVKIMYSQPTSRHCRGGLFQFKKWSKSLYITEKRTIVHVHTQLTIIPRVRVGYELAIIISYPRSVSGIIILLYQKGP